MIDPGAIDSDRYCRINLRVLVPGAGLCRLAWDIAYLGTLHGTASHTFSDKYPGFSCQGNEFSHFMLLGSYFMLNRYASVSHHHRINYQSILRTTEVNSHVIYPYIHSFSNIRNSEGLLRAISLPDVSPASLPDGSNFSLVAGKHTYHKNARVDSDVPHRRLRGYLRTRRVRRRRAPGRTLGRHRHLLFHRHGKFLPPPHPLRIFIDTLQAKNIVNYLRIIHRKLAPGGVWINLGTIRSIMVYVGNIDR